MRQFLITLILVPVVCVFSAPLLAHHGTATIDGTKKVTMKGVVTEWYWANPHCFLRFDVTDKDGKVAHWTAETSNPPDMINRGWSKNSLKPGDRITVTVNPVKNGQPIGRVVNVILPNGQALGSGFGGPAAGQDVENSSGSKSN